MLSAKNLKVSVVREDRKKKRDWLQEKEEKEQVKEGNNTREDIKHIYNKYNNALTRKHALIHSLPEIITNLLWFA